MHELFMRRCLELAEKGRGQTGINPMVGAVLVRGGKILAEGFHAELGSSHAENMLLTEFSEEIRPADILYVNLEPCCHEAKKTPPCANLIVERGVKNVVYGMIDPNPLVSGKGILFLNKKSIQVSGPILEQECRRMNRGFISIMTKHRPWITLKSAATVDGKFANPDGSPLQITSPDQDIWSHKFLRARHDAILVGVSTVIADDPLLTVRASPEMAEGTERRGQWRIILDSSLKIPLDAKVVNTPLAERTIIVTGTNADREKKRKLEDRGVNFFSVPLVRSQEAVRGPALGSEARPLGEALRPEWETCSLDGASHHFDWPSLWKSFTTPDANFHGISSILVEGGPKTWEMFRSAGMVDEEIRLVGM